MTTTKYSNSDIFDINDVCISSSVLFLSSKNFTVMSKAELNNSGHGSI